MALAKDRNSQGLKLVYRALVACIIAICVIITAVTVYRLSFRSGSPQGKQNDSIEAEEGQIFTGIGQLRVSTSDPRPGMVILFVSFVYYPSDKAFSEELVLRIGEFRNIISNYIGSFSIFELQKQDEESIKGELLSRFNAILRLGKIETMFFTDFMIIGEIH